MNRRSLLRLGVLAPLAPVVAAASMKLGSLGSQVQKVTPQLAVQNLLQNFARQSDKHWRATIAGVEYVDDLAVATYRTVARYGDVAPHGHQAATNAARVLAESQWVRSAYNAGSSTVQYAGKFIPPGQWVEIYRSVVTRTVGS